MSVSSAFQADVFQQWQELQQQRLRSAQPTADPSSSTVIDGQAGAATPPAFFQLLNVNFLSNDGSLISNLVA